MEDLIVYYVRYKKDGSCWKTVTIKKLEHNGRCAVCKKEPIGPTDLYYFNHKLFYADITTPPKGAMKVILIEHWFSNITRVSSSKLLIRCEKIRGSIKHKIIQPYEINLKNKQK